MECYEVSQSAKNVKTNCLYMLNVDDWILKKLLRNNTV